MKSVDFGFWSLIPEMPLSLIWPGYRLLFPKYRRLSNTYDVAPITVSLRSLSHVIVSVELPLTTVWRGVSTNSSFLNSVGPRLPDSDLGCWWKSFEVEVLLISHHSLIANSNAGCAFCPIRIIYRITFLTDVEPPSLLDIYSVIPIGSS